MHKLNNLTLFKSYLNYLITLGTMTYKLLCRNDSHFLFLLNIFFNSFSPYSLFLIVWFVYQVYLFSLIKNFLLGGLQDLESHMTTTQSCITVQEHFLKIPTITNQWPSNPSIQIVQKSQVWDVNAILVRLMSSKLRSSTSVLHTKIGTYQNRHFSENCYVIRFFVLNKASFRF